MNMQDCIRNCWQCRDTCQNVLFNYCLKMGGKHTEALHVKIMTDCMEICQTAADFMRRNSPLYMAICHACAEICDACADSCKQIGGEEMNHCAEICHQCAESCRAMGEVKKAA